jgi:hypothetical protein
LAYSLSSSASVSGVVVVTRGWGKDRRREEIDTVREEEDQINRTRRRKTGSTTTVTTRIPEATWWEQWRWRPRRRAARPPALRPR